MLTSTAHRMLLRLRRLAALALLAAVVTGCSAAEPAAQGEAAPADPPTPSESRSPDAAVEETRPRPRIAYTYEGGVAVVDARSGEVLLEEPMEGYLRLNGAGDGRHALLSRPGGFTVLDVGSWTEAHGDHGHSWSVAPSLTGLEFPAEEPGHVVSHHGRTVLFDDGTGAITSFSTDDLEGAEEPADLGVETEQAEAAHHGVAAFDHDGNLLVTVGTEEARTGVRVVSPDGETLAESAECPGVHGEAFAGDTAVFGCEDGVLVVDGATIAKVASPDPYGRIGNQAGHETSPFVLGDYKVDPDAKLERPTRIAVVDTRSASLRLVSLPASYSFRSLARTPDGDGLVLGTDGSLHVIDMAAARLVRSVPVVAPWREPLDWQRPRPAVKVVDGLAYVTDPAEGRVHVVDLDSGKVTRSIEVAHVPDELVAVTG